MKSDHIFGFLFLFGWLAGVALADAGMAKFLAAILPPYALYLVVERVLTITGFLP